MYRVFRETVHCPSCGEPALAEVERNRSGGKGNVSLDPTCLCELTEQEVYYMKDAARDAAREDSAYLNHFQEVYRREDE